MEASLILRITAVFFTFFSSIFGVCFPIYFDKLYTNNAYVALSERDWMFIMRAFAAGVMLGVAFIHLLFDGNVKLSKVLTAFPPAAFFLATIGTMIVLGFEQMAVQYIIGNHGDDDGRDDGVNSSQHDIAGNSEPDARSGLASIPMSARKNDNRPGSASYQHVSSGGCCEHTNAIMMIAQAESSAAIVKAYMLEISVAVHSIIIGISIGTLAGPENLKSLESLIFAICLHQFIEGLGLGTVIKSTSMSLGPGKVLIFVLTFGLSVSFGIIIGIFLSFVERGEDSPALDATTGVLNSLAAGILIYVALVEMVAEDFQSLQLAKRPELKNVMLAALFLGNLLMAILAIWA